MQPSVVFKKSSFYKFGTGLFLIILLGAIISSVTLYYVFPKELPASYTEALRQLRMLEEDLHLKTYLIYLPIAVFIFIGVIALSRSFTQKIVVPLQGISDFSKVLANGDFSKRPPLTDEELSPVVKRLNGLIDAYHERFHLLKDDMARLEKIQKNIGNHLEEGYKKEIKDELKELIEVTDHMDRILEKIRA